MSSFFFFWFVTCTDHLMNVFLNFLKNVNDNITCWFVITKERNTPMLSSSPKKQKMGHEFFHLITLMMMMIMSGKSWLCPFFFIDCKQSIVWMTTIIDMMARYLFVWHFFFRFRSFTFVCFQFSFSFSFHHHH